MPCRMAEAIARQRKLLAQLLVGRLQVRVGLTRGAGGVLGGQLGELALEFLDLAVLVKHLWRTIIAGGGGETGSAELCTCAVER